MKSSSTAMVLPLVSFTETGLNDAGFGTGSGTGVSNANAAMDGAESDSEGGSVSVVSVDES